MPAGICDEIRTSASSISFQAPVKVKMDTAAIPGADSGRTTRSIIMEVLNKEPPPLPPDVPERIAAVVARALRKAPADRYPDGQAFAAALVG